MLYDLTHLPSVLSEYVAVLRNVHTQGDRERFRLHLSKIGSVLAYELSKHCAYQTQAVQTPLGLAQVKRAKHTKVVATILRAGLALHQGVLDAFPEAESAFVGSYRYQEKGGGIGYAVDYISSPRLTDKVLIMTDPMLATGFSMIKCLEQLFAQKGTPAQIHIVSVIASKEGVARLQKAFPEADLWCAAIDEELNDKQYIVPGLGDAGDLAYGMKDDTK